MQDPRLAEAASLRLANDFAGAWSRCQAVLAERPGDAQALAIMAVCLVETGDLARGAALLDQAEQADPSEPLVYLYRSMLQEAQGNAAGALASAQRASELAPDRFDVWGRLGDLAGRAGDFALCARALRSALDADPTHPAAAPVALRLAGAEVEQFNLPAAAAALDMAEQLGLAGTLDVLRMRAEVARHAGDFEALREVAQRWHDRAPDDPEAAGALALALGQLGYYRRAIRLFQPVIDADPSVAENWAAIGRLYLGARDFDAARAAFDTALARDPRCAEATFGLARIHTFLGGLDLAAEMCRKTLEIDPENFEAYGQLCEVTGGRLSDAELSRLAAGTSRPGVPADRLSIGLFALGDAYHRRKQRNEAFAAWARANDTKKLQHNGAVISSYDRPEQERRVAWLERAFASRPHVAQQLSGPTPIFIVGMPRSGTTLIEAAIAAHDEVTAGGELSSLPALFEEFLRWARETAWSGGIIPESVLAPWRERYVRQLEAYGLTGTRWVTDKQPANFMAVGLIRQMFPQSPVIHTRRRPQEVAFSIFRRNFSRMWPFAHDLDDIAHYYALQARLGEHWAQFDPEGVTPLQYEQLVEDFEPQLRRVVQRCGLTWDDKCLSYYAQDRVVMTFSAVQVRKPPSREHLDSTTPYSDHLEPFRQALKAWPVDPQTGQWMANEGVRS